MKTLAAFLLLLCAPLLAQAEGIRCGSQIIERGSSSAELKEYCGDPVDVSRHTALSGDGTAGRDGVITNSSGDIDVEIWTYNFGPNQLMERVRIENGKVVQIDSMGYGY
jgi:hypothetical protein